METGRLQTVNTSRSNYTLNAAPRKSNKVMPISMAPLKLPPRHPDSIVKP